MQRNRSRLLGLSFLCISSFFFSMQPTTTWSTQAQKLMTFSVSWPVNKLMNTVKYSWQSMKNHPYLTTLGVLAFCQAAYSMYPQRTASTLEAHWDWSAIDNDGEEISSLAFDNNFILVQPFLNIKYRVLKHVLIVIGRRGITRKIVTVTRVFMKGSVLVKHVIFGIPLKKILNDSNR